MFSGSSSLRANSSREALRRSRAGGLRGRTLLSCCSFPGFQEAQDRPSLRTASSLRTATKWGLTLIASRDTRQIQSGLSVLPIVPNFRGSLASAEHASSGWVPAMRSRRFCAMSARSARPDCVKPSLASGPSEAEVTSGRRLGFGFHPLRRQGVRAPADTQKVLPAVQPFLMSVARQFPWISRSTFSGD